MAKPLLLAVLAVTALAAEDTVTIKSGVVQGLVTDLARSFLGIPFAAPPTGNLRWTYPTAPTPWGTNTYQATQWKDGCAQLCNLPPLTCPDTISEDCLNLNVYTPRASAITKPLPVMVFFPGGRFEQGGGGAYVYDGNIFANKSETVLVTTNYRLGALGFLGSTTIPGNYGLEDQRFALQWVRDNIAAFGGDPNQVTIFGQSAGGTSVAVHLTSSKSFGLYNKVIIESNPFALPMHDPISAGEVSKDFAIFLGCVPNDLACMRSKTTEEIMAASDKANDHPNTTDPVSMFYPWTPMFDGVRVEAQPLEAFAKGNFNKVPILLGNVEEEALLFIWEIQPNSPASKTEYIDVLNLVFGDDLAAEVLALYPADGYPEDYDYRYLMNVLGTDWIFTCSDRYVSRGIAKYNNYPLFVYRFDHLLTFDAWGPDYAFCVGHVCHGSELVYLYQTVAAGNSGFTFTEDEQLMADSLTYSFSNFAKSGDPNKPEPAITGMSWPAWNSSQDLKLTFETPQNSLVYNWRASYCDFFDTINYLNPKAGLMMKSLLSWINKRR